jgi:hypothetical protein
MAVIATIAAVVVAALSVQAARVSLGSEWHCYRKDGKRAGQ